ncbi:DUF354 domain-containing protein [Lunatimonas salinarum]|uniref:DUF354 domain-containing protein n=1 Tax=Lunatimonas salinarum TaxID=1774590 RepID=UPI001ADFCD50|nr:DUF354 domain-containing protein [Lunatimonas salinarum]
MKIWIDFINTPQVSFFEPLIEELTEDGHEFVLTCRDSANTVQLVKQKGWAHQIIGDRVEKSLSKKLLAFPSRIVNLYSYLKRKSIDAAICQSSFYLPLTAKLLGIPSIYTNDNEHAAGNIPSFLFANKIFIPENLSIEKIRRQGASMKRTVQYPGIKEGVYLWVKGSRIIAERVQRAGNQKVIYVRPEPQTAQYYSGKLNFMDDFLIDLSKEFKVTILARDRAQIEHYSQSKFREIDVPLNPVPFDEVAVNCLLFIGAGGSMTREMSMIGIPTISVYQGDLLDVDNFLIENGYMVHQPSIDLVFVKKMLDRLSESGGNSAILIEKGKAAYNLFKTELLNLKK